MSKVAQKKNQSSTQVLKTLKVLMDGENTMKDLMSKLNKDEKGFVFNNSVISKYINTCRYCGIKIPKINNKYCVANMPFGLNLSLDDISILNDLQIIVNKDMSVNSYNLFRKFMEKINMFSNRKIMNIDKDNYNLSFEMFERAVSQKRKVKLIFKDKVILECIPVMIYTENNKTFFAVYNKRMRNIDINRLSGMEVLRTKYIDVPQGQEQNVIFKIKGNLAKRYSPRTNEVVETNSDGTITVINKGEPADMLISRLLRYDDKCEIISPKSYRELMKQIIDDTLSNYGV